MPSQSASFDLSDQLTYLVSSLFTGEELRHLFGYWPAGRPLAQDVALQRPDAAALAVREVIKQGRVGEFFLLLQERHPLRRDEIDVLYRRWHAQCQQDGTLPEPLPISAEMERIQQYAEGDDALVHQETTALHLLHALLAVQAGYEAQARLCRLVPPDRLLRALRTLARTSAAEIPDGTRIVRQGYTRLWAQADALAQRRSGVKLQYPDMLLALCTLRSNDIGEYLRTIGVTWEAFDANVPAPASQVITTEDPEPAAVLPTVAPLQMAHYQDVYGRFVVLKKIHGEDLEQYTLDKFVHMLHSKSIELMKQPDIVDIEFVPYMKQGKPAIRANFRRKGGDAVMMAGEA